MGRLSKNTFKKLVLLYLTNQFDDGIYTSYRFQKLLYFSIKNLKKHPFAFNHTRNGQYSYNARRIKDSLASIEVLDKTELSNAKRTGHKWRIADNEASQYFASILPKIDKVIADSIDKNISIFGHLKNDELVAKAEADELLRSTPMGQILFEEELQDYINVDLDEDECEEIELALNADFIQSIENLVDAIETTPFEVGMVKVVESIL